MIDEMIDMVEIEGEKRRTLEGRENNEVGFLCVRNGGCER